MSSFPEGELSSLTGGSKSLYRVSELRVALPHSGHPRRSANDDGGGQGLALFLAADFPLVILRPNLSDSTSRGRGGGRDKRVMR